MKRLSLLFFVALFVWACATHAPSSPSSPSSSDAPSGWAGELSAFSSALARAGMSVPLAPRVCEEAPHDESSSCVLSWDDEIGCASIPTTCALTRREVLSVYARAITRARQLDDHAGRAEALVAAYSDGDASFAPLAQAIERDFDARRAATPARKKAPEKKPAAKPVLDAGPAPDAGALDEDTGDAGVVDAPVAEDAAAGDAGVVLTLADRIAGTWTAEEGDFRVVFVFCVGGRARYFVENGPPGLPERSGTWTVTEDPDTLTFTSDGRTETNPITAWTDDSFTLGEGKDVVTFRLRSRAASCG